MPQTLDSSTFSRALPTLLACVLALGTTLAQTIPATTDSPVATAHFTLAQQAAMNANIATARDHADLAIAADPTFARALALRGALDTDSERVRYGAKAMAAGKQLSADEREWVRVASDPDADARAAGLKTLAEKYPQDTWVNFVYGNEQMNAGDVAGAMASLERVLALDPHHPGALNMRAYVAAEMGDYALAEKSLRAYIDAHPNEANSYDSMGEIMMMAKRYDESAEYYGKALALDPTMSSAKASAAKIAVMRQLDRYEAYATDGDAAGVASLYWKRARVFPQAEAPLMGSAALEERLAKTYEERAGKAYTIAFETDEFVTVDSTTAVELGTITESTDGKPSEGKYISVWGRIDGEWLIVRDMWTGYEPSPEAMAEN